MKKAFGRSLREHNPASHEKVFLVLFLIVALLFLGARWVWPKFWPGSEEVGPVEAPINSVDVSKNYLSFSLNVQEFAFVDEGIETVNRVIDLHEELGVPIEIYLTNTMVDIYEKQAPDLLGRLKTSDVVGVSYHIRPPLPYYTNYDFVGLEEMGDEELYETVADYEEHDLDLNTGLPMEEPGGYERLKELMGYPPKVIGMQSNPATGKVISEVFEDKGAVFSVVHGGSSAPYESGECLFVRDGGGMDFGDRKYGLYVRPENVEIRLFQCLGLDPGEVIEDGLVFYDGDGPIFLNVKMHDNDFYSEKSSWTQAYVGKGRTVFEAGDFDYMDFVNSDYLLSEKDREEMWALYEAAVRYVAGHSDAYTTINAVGLEALLADVGTI